MAINLSTSFNLNSPLFLDNRQTVKKETDLDTLKADYLLPDGFLTFCEETRNYYSYRSADKTFVPLVGEDIVTHWLEPVEDAGKLDTIVCEDGSAVVVLDTQDIYVFKSGVWKNKTRVNIEDIANLDLANLKDGMFIMAKVTDDSDGTSVSWELGTISLDSLSDFKITDAKANDILIYDDTESAFVNKMDVQYADNEATLDAIEYKFEGKLVYVEDVKSFYKYNSVLDKWEAINLSQILVGATEPTSAVEYSLWLDTSVDAQLKYRFGDSWNVINDMSENYKNILRRLLQQVTNYAFNLKGADDNWYCLMVGTDGKLQLGQLGSEPTYPDLSDGSEVTSPSADYYVTDSDLTTILNNYCKVSEYETRIETLETQNADLLARVADLETKIADLEARVTTLETP